MSSSHPVVAVVGATGAAGSTLLTILAERQFPLASLHLLASESSRGRHIPFRGEDLVVDTVSAEILGDADIAFFAAGSKVAKEFAPRLHEHGGVAIDKSSAYRADPTVPLVVPEVNPDAVQHHHGIISNPNCIAIPLTVALKPLHDAFSLRSVTAATYQAASGGGRHLVAELVAQTQADARGDVPQAEIAPHILHGNVLPGGWSFEDADTEEERKVAAETRRVLAIPDLAVSVTSVRVPVAVGHSVAVWAEFAQSPHIERAREVLTGAPGIRMLDDPDKQLYPTPRDAAGQDEVLLGRLRPDPGNASRLAFFIAADNLRKGAATNAVQVAELLMQSW